MKNSHNTLKALISASPLAIITFDLNKKIQLWNPAAEKIFGWKSEEVIGKTPPYLKPEDKEEFNRLFENVVSDNAIYTGLEFTQVSKSGQDIEINKSLAPLKNNFNKVIGVVSTMEDTTEKKRIEKENYELLFRDPLTGLSNRVYFIKKLKEHIEGEDVTKKGVAILYIDLDRFKTINDSLGHDKGDILLKEVGARLSTCSREDSIVARMGGDEFAILIPGPIDADIVSNEASKIINVLKEGVFIKDFNVNVSPSIGIAMYPTDGINAVEVVRNADTAMYSAKAGGRNKYAFFNKAMHNRIFEKLETENMIRDALLKNNVIVYFQPKINLDTKMFSGVEALVRIKDENKIISPTTFISVAEESGLIEVLGERVLKISCIQGKLLEKLNIPKLKVAVNISAGQFNDDLVSAIKRILGETDFDPKNLELEITEGTLMLNILKSIQTLQELRKMGISIAIDDFGIGYSSLGNLKNLPIDTLKIDQSFIENIVKDKEDQAIVKAIISMAEGLRLNIVAEGVETQEQAEYLKSMGCKEVQGYLYCKPLSIDNFQNAAVKNYVSS